LRNITSTFDGINHSTGSTARYIGCSWYCEK